MQQPFGWCKLKLFLDVTSFPDLVLSTFGAVRLFWNVCSSKKVKCADSIRHISNIVIYDRVIASKIRRVDSYLCHTGRACRVQLTPLDISLGLQQGCSIISGTQSIPIKKGDAEQRNSNATLWNGYGTANPKWLPFWMQSVKWALFHRSDTSKPCWKTKSFPIWSKVDGESMWIT